MCRWLFNNKKRTIVQHQKPNLCHQHSTLTRSWTTCFIIIITIQKHSITKKTQKRRQETPTKVVPESEQAVSVTPRVENRVWCKSENRRMSDGILKGFACLVNVKISNIIVTHSTIHTTCSKISCSRSV